MARGRNLTILVGHVGQDPDYREKRNTKIASLSLATNETWKDQGGAKKSRTEWHRLTFFGKLAELVQQYVRRGSLIYIEGRLRTDRYTDAEGVDRFSTEVICHELELLSRAPKEDDEKE